MLVAEGATAAVSSANRRYSSAEDGAEVAQDTVAAANAAAGHSAVLGKAEAEAELLLLAALRANPGHANSLFNVAILRR